MKNSFCRICRGRFNLKYPPAAVDSKNKKSSNPPRNISVLISESGEISDNICWDCEETLLGFHKITTQDNNDEEEELVIVDDDEILYKNLEKSKRNHRLSKETEVIQIDSSDSDDLVIIPQEENIISVEAARTVGEESKNPNGGPKRNNISIKTKNKNTDSKMRNEKEDTSPRGRIVESKQCPICPYHSGIEFEVVCHIRQTHPQYIGDYLRFDFIEGDSPFTRRIIFAQLWTFFECKECGKIYERFRPHRKHITTHDRKMLKNPFSLTTHINTHNNNNNNNSDRKESTKVQPPPSATPAKHNKSLKRPLDEINDSNKSVSDERVKIRKISNDHNSKDASKTLVVKLHKSKPKTITKSNNTKQQSQSEKSKSRALLRKQQQLQARRERRRQKKEEEKLAAAALKAKTKIVNSAPAKPTFKMPTQPAPRASSVVKPVVQKLNKFKLSLTCKLCSKVFHGLIAWNSHMIQNHAPTNDEFPISKKNESSEFVCRACDKEFRDETRLKNHIRFSHRRKNRIMNMEVNGNDQDELCCQSETLLMLSPLPAAILPVTKQAESRDCDDQSMPMITESSALENSIPNNNLDPKAIEKVEDENDEEKEETLVSTSMAKSALLCQYCGALFSSTSKSAIEQMDVHQSKHIEDGAVKRIFVTKQQPKL